MRYRAARAVLRYALGGFFRQVDLQGVELVPDQGPVLFIANHTNAFIDPLVLVTEVRRPVTITAKSTLSANPLLAPLMGAMRVIAFHRRVDAEVGEADATRNVDAIEACVGRLREGGALLVFPEGVSHSDPGLRGFKTGAARIALRYLEDPGAADLTIVPVGLHFTKKDRWRSEAAGLVGEPIRARAWREANPEAGAGALTDAMRAWIERLTVNFAGEEERDLVRGAARLLGYRGAPEPLDRLQPLDPSDQVRTAHRLQRGAHELRRRDPGRFDALARETRRLNAALDALGVEPPEVGLPMHAGRVAMFVAREFEVLVVGFLPAALGALVNTPPLVVLRALVARLSKDEDHPASNAVFLSIPVVGLWWGALLLTAALLLPLAALPVVAAGLAFTAAVGLAYRDRAGRVARRVRTFVLWLRRPEMRAALDRDIHAWQAGVRAAEASLDALDRADTAPDAPVPESRGGSVSDA